MGARWVSRRWVAVSGGLLVLASIALGGVETEAAGRDRPSAEAAARGAASAGAVGRPAGTIAGLDSLAAATLGRAFDYLELDPAELGFDKLYARDDTFRLALVERLLGDPLALPGWQAEAIAALERVAEDPVELTGWLGRQIAAGDPRTIEPRPAVADTSELGAVAVLATAMEAFVADCREVEALLAQAFHALGPAERDLLLMEAPAFWGDEQDPLDQARRGALHFEFDRGVDTTREVSEDLILDLGAALDRVALTRAARHYYSAVAALALTVGTTAEAEGRRLPAIHSAGAGVTGTIVIDYATPWGRLLVGGFDGNTYSEEVLAETAFLFDLGGNDRYRGRVASAVGGLLRPFGALIDYGGDDIYEAAGRDYAVGGALLGLALLWDRAGDDVYRGGDGSLGAGFFGCGLLCDGAGEDYFESGSFSQGAGAFGLGALIASARDAAPPGPELDPDRAFEAGLVRAPGTGAVAVRHDENDTYRAARMSQGFASTFGAGLLYDRTGNDTYIARGRYRHSPLRPHDFQSLSQGFSIGFRPRAAGGVGLLVDLAGNDFYDAEVYAQGVSYWYSLGFLYDGAGNDRYHATQYAQGAGVHLAVGSLWDVAGDDRYISQFGVTQGTAHDLSVGMLLDEGGDDYYLVSDGQAVSITNSSAIFIDAQGDDFYATPHGGQGRVTWARGFSGAAFFLDLEGADTYSRDTPGGNGAVWSEALNAIGIDLDRDIELPGEVVPEIVLTHEDSLRAVEELFETASLWEVGSAREKVRRARAALIAKGAEALDYIFAEKLATQEGLEFRAISALARAHPDSFAARALAQLPQAEEAELRNVIALLGEIQWEPAVEPLGALLEQEAYESHWTRTVHALGRIGSLDGAPAVRPFVSADEERRRIYALAALASMRDSVSIPEIAGALSDPLLTVRAAALRALRPFGAAAAGPLCAQLARKSGHRLAQVRALGELAVALRDSSDAASLAARRCARRALMAELERPLEASAPATRAAAAEALLALGDQETRDEVRRMLVDESDPLVWRTYELALERALEREQEGSGP